ncbi:trehalose-phosphatase [Roseivivax sediminis]|uniref:Trehalose 6-phosphate phosphatase n=1 Tax=Roseivivax sediminis TaxID=936889 RepID=A0A1I1W0M8_9RHOB|nr:trehalose-phosphatase [Roseivivax sediminis]SFD88579.1 trehalose 6-phosphatase [Roseivivax sediminis]
MTDTPPNIDLAQHALFLDYDGTLAPIVDRPEEAVMPEGTRDILAGLRDRLGGALAIVSGRALADLRPLVAGLDVALSGSHGHELHLPGTPETGAPPLAEPLRPAESRLTAFAARNNIRMERKPGALTLHYRGMPHLEDVVRDTVRQEAAADPALKALHGNMVSEVVLADAGKGEAIRTLLSRPPFAGRSPVMIGDDVTDEHGFEAAGTLGGFGIKIGPGETAARYRLASVVALSGWLDMLGAD